MTELLKKLTEAKKAQALLQEFEAKVSDLKDEIWRGLKEKYLLVIDRETKEEVSWNPMAFDDELQLLLRSMIRKDTVIHIPSKSERRKEGYNLTQKHGLKWPRSWSSHSFMPYGAKIPKFKDDQWWGEYEHLHIDFSVLRNRKDISAKKLGKFFYFLDEILKLYRFYYRTEARFKKNFIGKDGEYALRGIDFYSDLETFADFLALEPKLVEHYSKYEKQLRSFKKRQDKLLQELKKYNKPYSKYEKQLRILLALKG